MRRRTLLGLGAFATVMLGIAGGAALWIAAPALQQGRLQPGGRAVMRAVAAAVLDTQLPAEPAARSQALDEHLARLEQTIRSMPSPLQDEFGLLLALLAAPPARALATGMTATWEAAETAEVQAVLQSMRSSSILLRRQSYSALRDLTHAAYFADPATWKAMGYQGPVPV